jgi:putative CocE/NonD family hydrolase
MADTPTPLHLYELGANRVVHTTSWPLPHAATQQWFFGGGRTGTATHSLNDGTLSHEAPVDGEDVIPFSGASDPCSASSEQWSGGQLSLTIRSAGAPQDPCVDDDRAGQAAPFALTYTSAPFPAAVMLGGPIGATIFATSTAKDCEWVVDVEDVAPDGSSRPLTEGALLGSMRSLDPERSWAAPGGGLLLPVHRLTAASPMPVTPDELTRYDIEVLPTVASIAAGHRLRVTVTTSDTPHLVPNAEQIANLLGGVYHLQHRRVAASFVELPIGPEGAP